MRSKPLRLIAWCLLITGAFAVLAIPAPASDDPTSKIEQESDIYYTVKKGDTLWDISNRYFNTHSRWPQIWSENQQIMNPHRIFPGERLRLFHQSWDATQATESSDQTVAGELPVIESRYYVYSPIHRIGFVTEQPATASGQIAMFQGDRNVQKMRFSENDSVYVTPAAEIPLKVGEVYAVYQPPIPVQDPESNDLVGYQYYKTGVIRIVENRQDYAVAKVEKAFRSIMVNDLLLPDEPISSKIEMIPGKGGVFGKIVKAEEGTEMFGDDSVAFINKGKRDGIQPGQTYAIYEDYPVGSTIDFVDFGSLLVLHAEATTATVLILRSDRSIKAPGYFRSQS